LSRRVTLLGNAWWGHPSGDYKVIVGSIAFWTVLQIVLPPLLDIVWPELHKKIPARKHDDLHVRFAAMLHAMFVADGAIRTALTFSDDILANPYYGYCDGCQFYNSVAAGYFLWDTFICIKHGWGFGYIMHGVLCAGCYVIVMHPFVHYHATLFLLFELSTPFLHARGLLIDLKHTKTKLFPAVNYIFAFVFFCVRICWGLPFSWRTITKPLWNAVVAGTPASEHGVPNWAAAYVWVGMNGLNALNCFWFYQMVRSVTKKRGATDVTSDNPRYKDEKSD